MEKARSCYQSQTLGEDHLDYGYSLSGLAGVHLRRGEVNISKELFKKVLKIQEKKIGKKHLDYATTLWNLAIVCTISSS